jgi:hypothetical protein
MNQALEESILTGQDYKVRLLEIDERLKQISEFPETQDELVSPEQIRRYRVFHNKCNKVIDIH